jgi:hypothetical protein
MGALAIALWSTALLGGVFFPPPFNRPINFIFRLSCFAIAGFSTVAVAQDDIPDNVVTLAHGYAAIARTAMDDGLADFPTARIRNVRATYSKRIEGGKARLTFCGDINAKNKFGGYDGWQHFALLPGNDSSVKLEGTEVIIEGNGVWGLAVNRFCNDGSQNWLQDDFTAYFSPLNK